MLSGRVTYAVGSGSVHGVMQHCYEIKKVYEKGAALTKNYHQEAAPSSSFSGK